MPTITNNICTTVELPKCPMILVDFQIVVENKITASETVSSECQKTFASHANT